MPLPERIAGSPQNPTTPIITTRCTMLIGSQPQQLGRYSRYKNAWDGRCNLSTSEPGYGRTLSFIPGTYQRSQLMVSSADSIFHRLVLRGWVDATAESHEQRRVCDWDADRQRKQRNGGVRKVLRTRGWGWGAICEGYEIKHTRDRNNHTK